MCPRIISTPTLGLIFEEKNAYFKRKTTVHVYAPGYVPNRYVNNNNLRPSHIGIVFQAFFVPNEPRITIFYIHYRKQKSALRCVFKSYSNF